MPGKHQYTIQRDVINTRGVDAYVGSDADCECSPSSSLPSQVQPAQKKRPSHTEPYLHIVILSQAVRELQLRKRLFSVIRGIVSYSNSVIPECDLEDGLEILSGVFGVPKRVEIIDLSWP
jgi:hypothetical protein